MEQKQSRVEAEQQAVRRSLRLVGSANALTILFSLHFYWVPAGARVHPVIWLLFIFLIGFVAFGCLPFRLSLFRDSRPVYPLWLAFILGVTPIPLAVAVLHHAAWLRGFSIS